MTSNPGKPKDAEKADEISEKKHESELLDEGLEESFPASDPPSVTIPGHADPKGPGKH